MSVKIFSTLLQNSVKSHAWVLVDVNIGSPALLSHGEVLSGRMYANGAYAISIMTLEDLFLLRLYVVYLVGVSCSVDDNVILQIM